MKIGLIDVDGHNFPNLALMKISAYHKNSGDDVEWYFPFNTYDKVYKSKVFTFTPDHYGFINNTIETIQGGTGYNINTKLHIEIDNCTPDYDLYPISNWYDKETAYGFITRGCPNKCDWCVVPEKEGKIKPYMDIEDIAQEFKKVILLDNSILASKYGLQQIENIIKLKLKVDFNQGLDARIIANDKDIAKLLSKVKWLKPLRMACDTRSQMKYIKKATELLRKYNTTPQRYFIYLLVQDIKDALYRAEFLKTLNLDVFAQPYRDFRINIEPDKELKQFARWVNHKAIFKSVKFENYKP